MDPDPHLVSLRLISEDGPQLFCSDSNEWRGEAASYYVGGLRKYYSSRGFKTFLKRVLDVDNIFI